MRPIFCEDAAPLFYNLFDFSIAPPLLYYAYIPILILTLVFAGLALFYNQCDRNSRLFTGVSLSLGFLVLMTFFQWIAAPITLVMFSWEMWNLALALLALFTVFFLYAFIFDTEVKSIVYVPTLLLFLPIVLLTPTTTNISWFDLYWCEGVMHPFMMWYTYSYTIFAMVTVAVVGWVAYTHPEKTKLTPRLVAITAGSTFAFLFFMVATAILGDLGDSYQIEVAGPVGAVIFLAGMAYVSVNYKHFEIKAIWAEVLVVALLAVISSMVFVQSLTYIRYVSLGSLLLVAFIGYLLSRSVRKEVEQRKEIERQEKKLTRANKRLKELDQLKSEFVSIASHQLRSPLTAIQGYTSMLTEGTYGKISPKAKEAIEKIGESSRFMSLSVEDYLNVSRIQTGNMKYEYSDFNLRDLAERVADELRPEALKKGLLVTFKTDLDTKGIVHADIGKTKQVIQNLVDNSMKYTPKGSIKVFVHDNKKKKRIYVDIIDTGIGMSKETMQSVFDKFERAHNANEVNVTGTGLGLFVARQMAEAMGGDVYASSEGEDKGSTFTIELPVEM